MFDISDWLGNFAEDNGNCLIRIGDDVIKFVDV